jgi:hypothetical protein
MAAGQRAPQLGTQKFHVGLDNYFVILLVAVRVLQLNVRDPVCLAGHKNYRRIAL